MSMFLNTDKDLRTRTNEALNRYSLKQIDLAKDTGVHHSTLSLWLQGKVKINTRLEENIEKWLLNLQSNKPKINRITNRLNYLKAKRDKINLENINTNHGFGNLIPVNLNIEIEGKKLKEIFFWDYNEPYLTVEHFAKIITDEHQLPLTFESEICNQMNKQISQYQIYENLEGEIIKVIKLDIRLGDKLITDKFEWDINNPENKPEEFATKYVKDLGLGTEFILPITHSIREQVLELRKASYMDKRFYYQMLYNRGNKSSAPQKVVNPKNVYREGLDCLEWQPYIKTISLTEIQKYEQKEERKNRYVQRKR
jgi:SWI/SNF-related matrix-associated actin-dependent regulator of chromatin subfamily B protein 1